MKKPKFYSLDNILATNSHYNLIIGERSNGKTYACLEYGLKNYFNKNKEQFAIVRRWQDDFRGKRGATMFDGHVQNGVIKSLSNGKWDGVYYYSGRWYLSKYDKETDKKIIDNEPFAYAFSISSMEHDKSTSYPMITTIIFDEFLTRGMYINDEFVSFMNVISTIVRHRTNIKIFMLGNTVNMYSPYFSEMGLTHIKDMKQGTIDTYTYGDSELRVAVEYCSSTNKDGKPSDVYFAFDNPKLNMITGGAWELDIYPHLPTKYLPKEVIFYYYIKFDDELLQCEVIKHEDILFTFIHRKTTPIKDEKKSLIFSTDYSPRYNWRRHINKPVDKLGEKIFKFYVNDKVFYQDNEVGEIVRNYLVWCGFVMKK